MKNSEQNKNRLDQLLKDQLAEGTAHVPDFVWDRIEEELFPKKKRRFLFWWFFGGACIILISTIVGVAFSEEKLNSQRISLSQNNCSDSTITASLHPKIRTNSDRSANFISFKTSNNAHNHDSVENQNSTGISNYSNMQFYNANQGSNRFASITHSKSKVPEKVLFEVGSSARSGIENESNPVTDFETTDTNDLLAATEKINENPESDRKTQTDSLVTNEFTYAEILALIKREFPLNPEEKEKKRLSNFSIGIYGGSSLYHTAVFKDYFTSGQLSNRSFTSSGFELGLQVKWRLGNRFQIYTGVAFNQKQTQFNYNVAITESDYFTYLANDEKVPLANIRDDGSNSCFLAKDVAVRYQMQSILISLGTSFEFLKIGKLSVAADLRVSGNLQSSIQLKETRILSIEQPYSEQFSYFQPGAGLIFNYKLNDRISVGLSPFFSKQFYTKKSFLHRMDELVIPVTFSFRL